MQGSDIKQYLDENGIKYSYVAEQTKIPLNVLSPILNDKRKLEVNEYFSICDALSVPLETFAGKAGSRKEAI